MALRLSGLARLVRFHCYGWTDRVKRSIEHHTRLGVVRDGPDAGGLGSLLEYNPGIYYNMTRSSWTRCGNTSKYTNDLTLMGEIFPCWLASWMGESAASKPGNEYLYEKA